MRNLQRIRKNAGYASARSFAERLGVPTSTYVEWEAGRFEPSLERAVQIADALGCSVDELVGRDCVAPVGDVEARLLDSARRCRGRDLDVLLAVADALAARGGRDAGH